MTVNLTFLIGAKVLYYENTKWYKVSTSYNVSVNALKRYYDNVLCMECVFYVAGCALVHMGAHFVYQNTDFISGYV